MYIFPFVPVIQLKRSRLLNFSTHIGGLDPMPPSGYAYIVDDLRTCLCECCLCLSVCLSQSSALQLWVWLLRRWNDYSNQIQRQMNTQQWLVTRVTVLHFLTSDDAKRHQLAKCWCHRFSARATISDDGIQNAVCLWTSADAVYCVSNRQRLGRASF